MKKYPRRSFLKTMGALPVLFSLGMGRKLEDLAHAADGTEGGVTGPTTPESWPTALELSRATAFPPGYLTILQGPTSQTEALINVFSPRLKKYVFTVVDPAGTQIPVEHYEKVLGPGFYNIDKLQVTGLSLGVNYLLQVRDGSTLVDEREFAALDTAKSDPQFALLSCMADDIRFHPVIDTMWERLRLQNPDFIILNGDTVYVDSFEFVERKKATEFDLWQRYTDAFRRLPVYHWRKLKPIFSTWDDHDFGTNDGDRDFISKEIAARLFRATFGGKAVTGWEQGPNGVSSSFRAFGQRFYFMDDRTFRQPNKNQVEQEAFGHWGQSQHDWLLNQIAQDTTPAWIVNGNQNFNGKALDFKEAFEANHPVEFVAFIDQLKQQKAPVVFASGDIHFSEIMRVPAERMGYETFEFTSSPMHSYAGDGWENPMRVDGAFCKEFNFLMFRAKAMNGGLRVDVKSIGLADRPYFEMTFSVQKP